MKLNRDRKDPEHRAATGVVGLDDILSGGLPKNRLYLVQGDPGVGKTTLAMQFLLHGAELGESCLYITLSETREELESVADSHGWSLQGISLFELSALEDRLAAEAQTTLLHPAEVELTDTIRRLLEQVEQIQPARVVLDSLSELRLLAQEPLRYRRQLLALKTYFAGRGTTVLLLDDRTSEPTDLQVQSIAHGVIELQQLRPEYGAERRRLSVAKLRGSRFRGGYHDYTITVGGLKVFPRLIAAEHHETFVAGDASSGLPQLDALLGGGLGRGTNSLFLGPAGTGKSSLATQYAIAAADRGEKTALFAFDENFNTLLTRSHGLGMPLKEKIDAGFITLRQIDAAELSPGEFCHIVRAAVEEHGARLIIIDSLNGYLNSMPEERFLTAQLHELFAYLAQRGVVTILVLAQHGLVGNMQNSVDLTYLADTVVLLRFFEAVGAVKKAIAVIKKRSGFHENTIREYFLREGKGIGVGPALSMFQGVLTGVPTMTGTLPSLNEGKTTPLNFLPLEERVLVLTPTGADGRVARDLLVRGGLSAEVCQDLPDLLHKFEEGAGCLLIAQEALHSSPLKMLDDALRGQGAWSDIPVILLSTERLAREADVGILRSLGEIANIMMVERPCRAATLLNLAKAALRGARRQYSARKLLNERAHALNVAEQANLAKDRFLATLSHELRTPLTPVLATTGFLLRNRTLPADVVEDLNVIQRNIELEARLIDDLLDLTRVTRGKLQLNFETVDVHSLIEHVYEICGAEIRARGISIEFRLDAATHFVRADGARLHQMIWNLLKNAGKFAPAQGAITVTTRNVAAAPGLPDTSTPGDEALLQIEIRDNGIGITAEQLPKLFKAFEQGGGEITRQFGGLGLGLAITRALAEAQGAQVKAESEGAGKGAVFTLTIPTVVSTAIPSAPVQKAVDPVRSMTILLVEDHRDTARVMERVLRSWGHKVILAHTLADACHAARERAFDLVISDIGLPDGTGVEFVEELRTHTQVPAIALTGYGMEDDVKRCLAAGFQAHLTKPVSFAKLESAISQLAGVAVS